MTSGSTPLLIYQLDSSQERLVSSAGLTTRDAPVHVIRNLMKLHEMAAPGAIFGLAKSLQNTGVMQEVLTKVVEPHAREMAERGVVSDIANNPLHLMQSFYASSFLENEEARHCLVYSMGGKIVGFAHVGRFARQCPTLTCSISNMLLSPAASPELRAQIIASVSAKAIEVSGEASLITKKAWGGSYVRHGFAVEPLLGSGAATGTLDDTDIVRCRRP